MTSPPIPQDGSPLLKHKKYVHEALVQLFLGNATHVHTLRGSLLKLTLMDNPTIIPEAEWKVYEQISLRLRDLEVKYELNTKRKDQSN